VGVIYNPHVMRQALAGFVEVPCWAVFIEAHHPGMVKHQRETEFVRYASQLALLEKQINKKPLLDYAIYFKWAAAFVVVRHAFTAMLCPLHHLAAAPPFGRSYRALGV
jgi:hypothetical protein